MESSVEAILKKLESLSRQDRRWVIERLPDSVKSALLSGQYGNDPSVRVDPILRVPMASSLAGYSPLAVAQVLAGEQGWLIEVLLRDGQAAWRKQVLFHLPAASRSSATALLHAPARVSTPVLESLCKSVRQKLDASGSTQHVFDGRPRWQLWRALQTLRARIRL